MREINPLIFKGYDIRGIYPVEINEGAVYKIGAAFCEYLSQKKHFGPIVLGRDARTSSPSLAEAASRAISDQGRDIIDIGICSTPLFYFSFNSSKAAGGVMATASHNPGAYNGLKLMREGGRPVYKGDGLQEVARLAESAMKRKIGAGKIMKKDFSGEYLDFLIKHAKIARPLKVVADASSGSAGRILKELLGRLNVECTELFFEPDGDFANHSPDPLLADARKPAEEKVVKIGADLGFILDGDGDRIVFIDDKGKYANPSVIYAFLLDYLLKEGDTALAAISSSKIVRDVAARKQANLERIPIGHASFKEAMRSNNARFGGEPSGHFYFRDFFHSDSALLTLVYVLSLVSQKNEPLSETLKPYQKYFMSGEINLKIEDIAAAIDRLKKEFADAEQSFADGLTAEYDDWWFNIRASQTEPIMRVTIEAASKELLEKQTKLVLSLAQG